MKTFSIFVTSFIPVFMPFPTEKQNEYKYLNNYIFPVANYFAIGNSADIF